MLEKHGRKNEGKPLDLTCSICGKPIAGSTTSDLSRSLFKESRCTCMRPKLVVEENGGEVEVATPEQSADTGEVEATGNTNGAASEKSKDIPAWQAAVLANLPEQYEVLSMIGEGGLGTVWKVRDQSLDKIFAIKVLRSWLIEDNNALNRFEQEAEAARSLNHANLATVHGFAMGKRGAPYLVMDYLEGKNLAKIIKEKGSIDVPRAINLFIQIAEAVEHAHSKDVLHRDIKPTNIIVENNEDGGEIVKLVDFGIAKVLPSETGVAKGQTRTGEVFGSPPYMSPEMCLGNQLDNRSDIYAMGCVMYEALSGSPPFSGESPIKTMIKHTEEEPLPIRKASKEQIIPHDLEYVVMRCLEKSAADRYQSMQELADDLKRIRENKPVTRVTKLAPTPRLARDLSALRDSDSHRSLTPGSSSKEDRDPLKSFAPDPTLQEASGSRKPLALPTDAPLPSDSGPYRSLASDAAYSSGTYKPFTPDSSLPYSSGAYRPLDRESVVPADSGPYKQLTPDPNRVQEAESLRSLDSESLEAIDPYLFRLYQAQSQSLKIVCGVLVVLLAVLASAYVSNSFHPSINTSSPAVSERSSPGTDQELLSAVDRGAEAFMALQQFDNAAPLLEVAVKTQEHMGTETSLALARDQEGLGRCYSMLGQLDRSAHWYERALHSYESLLVRSGAHFVRNHDWAAASTCAKDYADVLRKLNRNTEAQAIELKWINP